MSQSLEVPLRIPHTLKCNYYSGLTCPTHRRKQVAHCTKRGPHWAYVLHSEYTACECARSTSTKRELNNPKRVNPSLSECLFFFD